MRFMMYKNRLLFFTLTCFAHSICRENSLATQKETTPLLAKNSTQTPNKKHRSQQQTSTVICAALTIPVALLIAQQFKTPTQNFPKNKPTKSSSATPSSMLKKPSNSHSGHSVSRQTNSALDGAPDAPEDVQLAIAQFESRGTVEEQTSPIPEHYILRPATPPQNLLPAPANDPDLQRALRESEYQEDHDIITQQDQEFVDAQALDRALIESAEQARTTTSQAQPTVDNPQESDDDQPVDPRDAVKNSFLARFDPNPQNH